MTTLKNAWETVRETFSDGLHVAAEKTEEITRVGRIKLDIIGIKKSIEHNLLDLGKFIYDLNKEDEEKDFKNLPRFLEIISSTTQLEEKLKAKQEEIHSSVKEAEENISKEKSTEHTELED